MPKGKPWIREEEQILIELTKKGKSDGVISRLLGKPEGAIYMKMKCLGLEVVVSEKINSLLLIAMSSLQLSCRVSRM